MAAEVLVQITDLHLVAGSDAPEAEAGLRAAAALVGRLDPAPVAILVTGDLTDDGAPEAYAKVRAALDPLGLPVHPIAGNHDERAALRAAFADHPGVAAGAPDAPVQYAVTCGTTRVVLCDSVVPGSPGGALDGGRLAWLAERLAEDPGTPTVVALHHPPVCTGITAMDDISLRPEDAAGLAEVLAAAPQVERVVCGHAHRAAVGALGRVPVLVAPSATVQLRLDLRPGAALEMGDDPTGVAVHVRLDDGTLTSHVVPLPG